MATLLVDIVSAERSLFTGEAVMVTAPGSEGELGIYPRHVPLLTMLRPGEISVHAENGTVQDFYVSGGILEVQPHMVTVLSDTALRAQDIDEAAALQAKEEAEKLLQDKNADVDYAAVQTELLRAVAQLRLIRKKHK